jgi:hypothetical protein
MAKLRRVAPKIPYLICFLFVLIVLYSLIERNFPLLLFDIVKEFYGVRLGVGGRKGPPQPFGQLPQLAVGA